MDVDSVVVITYPGHFYITLLSLRSVVQHQQWAGPIHVVYDDCSELAWPDYAQCFAQAAGRVIPNPINMIPFSSVAGIEKFHDGWYRQQIAKLFLDTVLPDRSWFLLDGDVVLETAISTNAVPITILADWQKSEECLMDIHFTNYVKHMLGQGPGQLWDGQERLITSGVPYRFLDGKLLPNLRQHCEQQIACDFIDYHIQQAAAGHFIRFSEDRGKMAMTEWELIECYRAHILGEPLNWVGVHLDADYEYLVKAANKQQPQLLNHIQVGLAWCNDAELGQRWFENQQIKIDKEIWQKIYQKH